MVTTHEKIARRFARLPRSFGNGSYVSSPSELYRLGVAGGWVAISRGRVTVRGRIEGAVVVQGGAALDALRRETPALVIFGAAPATADAAEVSRTGHCSMPLCAGGRRCRCVCVGCRFGGPGGGPGPRPGVRGALKGGSSARAPRP